MFGVDGTNPFFRINHVNTVGNIPLRLAAVTQYIIILTLNLLVGPQSSY